jgi:hypothetical protein
MAIPNMVSMRREDNGNFPAVNVKPAPLWPRLPADLQAVDQKIIDRAFEKVQADWWMMTPQDLAETCFAAPFKGATPVAKQVGRGGGWVIVEGLRDAAEWNQKQRAAWARFEKAIHKSMLDAEQLFHEEIRHHFDGT